MPAQHFWDPSLLKLAPGVVIADDRPGAPADNIFWAGNLGEAGAVWYAYQSAWLPASLLEADRRDSFADALFAAAKHLGVALHCNKGLAGASADTIAAAKDTAMNPAVTDSFALAISGALGQPAYPGVPGHEPDAAAARSEAETVDKSMNEIRKLLPSVGSYVWETDFFQPNWQDAFWGENYVRLRAVKDKYDPAGLFFVHHGVGSEGWSADGFTPVELTVFAYCRPRTPTPYTPSTSRYNSTIYNRCGRSGMKLRAISLGLWHNFGFDKSANSMRAICRRALDLGVTHFDLANNYGPRRPCQSSPLEASCVATFEAIATSSSSPPEPAISSDQGLFASGSNLTFSPLWTDYVLANAQDESGRYNAANRTVKRWVVLPIADLAWCLHHLVPQRSGAFQRGLSV